MNVGTIENRWGFACLPGQNAKPVDYWFNQLMAMKFSYM